MTPAIEQRSLYWLDYLSRFLIEPHDSYCYPNDDFVKDYRFAAAMTVPAGAQIIDIGSKAGTSVAMPLLTKSPLTALKSLTGTWFRVHTEGRYLSEFNEEGWDNCYLCLADLLHKNPNVMGMLATSWFYDPALEKISPRLAYLAQTPRKAGARIIKIGSSEFDRSSATKTSQTRRKLYEAGQYIPTSYTVMWQRNDLINWAQSYGKAAWVPDSAAI